MDGREQLRRYLEQRREAGERELVLDGLDVGEVMRLLGADAASGTREPMRDAPSARAPEGGESGDWRAVLRSSGVAPGTAEQRDAERREVEKRDATSGTEAHVPASAEPPIGLVVEGGRELFGAMADLESLEAVAQAVASCKRCPLYATAKNPVPGQGNPNADLLIVGEAPGATEDEQGLAFVGAAGQLLTKILAAVNLQRDDVFICNVLKHRPPGNRNPMPDEVTACSPYLLRQFELVRPKAILALGTFAAQTLLQTKLSIGKLRSQVHRFHGVPLIVTYHPAALLRNPSWKRPTWEDVQLVRRILDSAPPVARP